MSKFSVRFKELKALTGLSSDTCTRRVKDGSWQRGIHFFGDGAARQYNWPLIQDWLATRDNPAQHQRAIADFLNSLPSNGSERVGRKAKKIAIAR